MAYDVQTKIMNEQDIKNYHENYVNIIKQIIKNPEIKVNDLKLN